MNAGFVAVECARYLGAREVILVGVDCGVKPSEPAHHEGFPIKSPDFDEPWKRIAFKECRDELANKWGWDFGLPVVNCTEGGFLTGLTCMPLAEKLEQL